MLATHKKNLGRYLLLTCSLFAGVVALSSCQSPSVADQNDGANRSTDLIDDLVITVASEQLQGKASEQFPEISEFLGIPFAQPPLGDLRWRAPQNHQSRAGVQNAQSYAPACYQGSGGVDWYVGVAAAFGHAADVVEEPTGLSEDCLYLNVWTPSTLPKGASVENLPVLVWIHGGGNTGGWAYEPNYVGASLARQGIVVVSIAYRLGIFGFFSHPGMESDQQAHIANFGLLDQIQGLQWVKDNIASFGGNPNMITVAGESAGSANIGYMLASPLAKELFQRSIHQSGSFELNDFNTVADVHAEIDALGGDKQASNSDRLAALRELDSAALLELANNGYSEDHFYPVVDGKVLPDTVYGFYEKEENAARDIMVGTTADEWFMYIDEPVDQTAIDAWLNDTIPSVEKPPVLKQLDGFTPDRSKLELLITARNMRCPGYYLAEKNATRGGRSWVYHFARQRNGTGGEALRVYHGAELPYMFDTHDDWLPTDGTDRKLTSTMVDYWVNFVKSGDPNTASTPAWPEYSKAEENNVQVLGGKVFATKAPHQELCRWLAPDSEV